MFFLLCLPVEAHALGLMQAYQMAQHYDATFLAARKAFAVAAQQVPQARAGLLPKLDLTGADSWSHNSTSFGGLPSTGRGIRSWNWALKLKQPLFRVSRIYAYRESGFAVKQAEFRLAYANADLILRVAKAYFGVLIARGWVRAAQAQVVALRQQLARAKHRFKAGMAAVTDVYVVKSRLELGRAQEIAALASLQNKRAELARITDERASTLAALGSTAIVPSPIPDRLDAWLQRAREDNLRVRERDAALSAATAKVGRAHAAYLPRVDLTASYGGNYASGNHTTLANYSTNSESWTVGVQVTMPLYSGGRTDSQMAGAVAKRDQVRFQLQSARRRAAMDARKAFNGIEDGLARISALEASLQAARSAVKGSEVGYRLGIKINLDVLDAQKQLYATERELIKARYDTLLQGMQLKAAAGDLNVQDLETLDMLLTARQEMSTVREHTGHAHVSKAIQSIGIRRQLLPIGYTQGSDAAVCESCGYDTAGRR